MNDDQQNDQNLVQNQPQDTSLPNQPQPTSTPVSPPQKEAQPYYDSSDKDNFIEVSEKEPQIRPEVENAGVYKVSDKIKLDKEARNAGLTEAKESAPVSLEGGKVTLPLNPVQAKTASKGDISNSITWLANLILVYLKKLGGGNA